MTDTWDSADLAAALRVLRRLSSMNVVTISGKGGAINRIETLQSNLSENAVRIRVAYRGADARKERQ